MEFKVPGQVLDQIAEYDPTKPKPQSGKPRNTLGLVDNLFPTDIVPDDVQSAWAVEINRERSDRRYRSLVTDTSHAYVSGSTRGWAALWHTKPSHPDHGQYVFGFSVAYRAKVCEQGYPEVDGTDLSLDDIAPHELVKYGRSQFRKHTCLVTESDLDKWNLAGLPNFGMYRGFHGPDNIGRKGFQASLSEMLPIWGGNKNLHSCFSGKYIFDKILKEINPARAYLDSINVNLLCPDYKPKGDAYQDLKSLICSAFPNLSRVMSSPFFEREIRASLEKVTLLVQTSESSSGPDKETRNFLIACQSLSAFIHIYGDSASADYCQRIWKSYSRFRIQHLNRDVRQSPGDECWSAETWGWIRDNVPVASMVNMAERSDEWTLFDTFRMVKEVLDRSEDGYVLPRPKRWRAGDWHDTVNAELFKLRVPYKKLPQDLFPQPVKVDNLTFFQPRDTHQLGEWGQAVHNCVGNAGHYAGNVQKKKELLVLALRDGLPYFTVQLEVEGGVMTVKQIVKRYNGGLTEEDRAEYMEKFGKALEIREGQIEGGVV